jgi:RNA polymerase sigma factor (TIGR02999 family)
MEPCFEISCHCRSATPAHEVNMAEITIILRRWESGDPAALEELMPLVYPQLRQVAAAYMGRERRQHVLQATVLVHELYIRLLQQRQISWNDRRHFFVFAARAMRLILIDHARGSQSQSRGSGAIHVPLNEALVWVELGSPQLIDLDLALEELAAIAPLKVQMVEMRYFLGCTAEETADLLGISKSTVDRELRFIKTWLFQRLSANPRVPPPSLS